MAIKVGINGFGRIGRCFFRAAWNNPKVEVVGINDLFSPEQLAHLLKYDSVHGKFAPEVSYTENGLVVDKKEIRITAERDPAKLPWKELGAQVALESTGIFRKRPDAAKHLEAGAGKVVISAPATEPDATFVMGVNNQDYDPAKHHVVSNASCTTNCLAPVAKVLDDVFGIEKGLMTTTHSYTNDQRILDLPHKDPRRARAAAVSMIPTTTGAAKAVGLVLPNLQGRLSGLSIRVPTPNVSLVDLVAKLKKETTVREVNEALKAAASDGPLAGFLGYSEEPLVSCDYNGDPRSSIVDAPSTYVVEDLVKVLSWYDNEWGYSNRLVDLIVFMMERG